MVLRCLPNRFPAQAWAAKGNMFLSLEPASARRRQIYVRSAWRALERSRDGLLDRLVTVHEDATDKEEDRCLRCRGCGHTIARERDRINVQGTHEHHCTNPLGLCFRIGCFREAPGGAEAGEATLEHTWFAGYRWRIMLCAQCATHLGWSFHAQGQDFFYGLILDRLHRSS